MEWGMRVWNVMERKGEGGLPKSVGCRATTREMSACQKECWIDFSSSNQGLVSRLRGGSKMGMVVMELGVGIPQIKGCSQWVYCLWKNLSLKPLKRSLDLFSPSMANSLLPTPRGAAVAFTLGNFWGLRMNHKVTEMIELKLLLCEVIDLKNIISMEYVGIQPTAGQRLPR
ncbi:unnamed protein product [Malus baccata var. baccata]